MRNLTSDGAYVSESTSIANIRNSTSMSFKRGQVEVIRRSRDVIIYEFVDVFFYIIVMLMLGKDFD